MADFKKLVSRTHPKYSEYSARWTFWKDSYLGGPDYVNSYLFKYFKEGAEEFAQRKERAYRENHTKKVVDLINSYLFKEDAKRKTSNTKIKAFHDNFDGKGTSISQFMKKLALWASVEGRMYVVMDKRPLPEEERTGTQADNIDPSAQPYCYMVFPQDVKDIAFDENGAVRWALIRETKRDDEDPLNCTGDVSEFYRLWMPGKWMLLTKEGNVQEEGDTGLDIVPIVIVDSEENDEYVGQSLIGDVAYLDRAIFNNWSRLDTIVCDQTFSQLIFPVEGLPAEILTNEKLREQFLTLATNRIILYSAAAQAPPCFISPDASQADFILRMIESQITKLYASIGLQGEVGNEVKTESGVSKAYDFDKLNKMLASRAGNLEQAEIHINKIFSKWTDIQADVEVEYPDEFDVKSLSDEVALAQELALLDVSETFTKEIMKAVALKALPKADKKTIDTIFNEIDAKQAPAESAEKEGVFPFDKKPDAGGEDEDTQ